MLSRTRRRWIPWVRGGGDSQGAGDGLVDPGGVVDRGEIDQVVVGPAGGERAGQAGLADTAQPGHRDEALFIQQAARPPRCHRLAPPGATSGDVSGSGSLDGAGQRRVAGRSDGSWLRIDRSTSRSSAPGLNPSSSRSRTRARWKACRASCWRPARYSVRISSAQRRSRNGSASTRLSTALRRGRWRPARRRVARRPRPPRGGPASRPNGPPPPVAGGHSDDLAERRPRATGPAGPLLHGDRPRTASASTPTLEPSR